MSAEVIYQRPWLYPKQRAAIFTSKRYGITEASTKCGKTVGCIVWLFEQALQGKTGWQYWWVAPSTTQTKIAYRRLKLFLRKNQTFFTANDTELRITIQVGTTICFKTGEKPDLLYGEDVHAAVLDEASRMREAAWHAVRTTLTATQGPVRIIGNVRGRRNWAYVMARKAESNDVPDMHYAKLIAKDAIDAGILTAAEVEDARQQLPEVVFNELYNAVPSDDAGNPFGLQHIAACVKLTGGNLSSGDPAIWGWDLAKSVDFTFGVALDREACVCRTDRFHDMWPGIKSRIMGQVGRTPAVVESNMDHDQMVEDLRRNGHDNYRGFLTTAVSKQQILEGLAVGIQQHKIGLPDGVLRQELETFEYVVSRSTDGRVRTYYSAPEGLHDDGVIALAIAWHHFQRTPMLVGPAGVTAGAGSKWTGAGGGWKNP